MNLYHTLSANLGKILKSFYLATGLIEWEARRALTERVSSVSGWARYLSGFLTLPELSAMTVVCPTKPLSVVEWRGVVPTREAGASALPPSKRSCP